MIIDSSHIFATAKTTYSSNDNLSDKTYDANQEKLMIYIQSQVKRAKVLSKIINTTTNQEEFYMSLNEATRILYDLSQYENTVNFSHTPSDDLARIVKNREKTIELFEKRKNFDLEEFARQCNDYVSNKNIENINDMTGHEFERFCAELLLKNGFLNVEVTQGSGDHGIDILAEKDDITYAIQCKCYSSNIGNAAVQQAHTGKSIYHRDIAVVLTNQYFTQQAKEEAAALGVKLWDRDKLNEMISISS